MNKQVVLPIIIILIAIIGGAFLLQSSDQNSLTRGQIQESGLRKVDLQIDNLFCIGCRASVVNSIMAYDGVIQADADTGAGSGWVIYDPELITKEQIVSLPIFDAYTATIIDDTPYTGSSEQTSGGTIPENLDRKLNIFAKLLQEKNVTLEAFFQKELDEAMLQGDWDKANNLLDNYIEAYEQN